MKAGKEFLNVKSIPAFMLSLAIPALLLGLGAGLAYVMWLSGV